MNLYKIYHNPKCSKSRQTLAILQDHQIQPVIIEYLKTPLNIQQLKELRSYFDLEDFVRHNEPIFKTLNLTLNNEEEVLDAMLEEPILMQRPIVTYGACAVIARPAEKVLALLQIKA